MACIASHPAVLMSELGFVFFRRRIAPGLSVLLDCFCQSRLFAVVRVTRSDRVLHLHHFPFLVLLEHRPLVQPVILPEEAALLPGCTQSREICAASGRCRARSHQWSSLLDSAMAIHAVDLDGVARLAVEFAVAVTVLLEVAVHTMHPLFKVDVLEVYRLLELLRIVEGNNLVVRVEQVALAVVLEDSAEDPS